MITFSQLGRQGRLGNQLWQISATIATAKKNNTTYLFPSWEYEPYFNLHGCFSSNIGGRPIYQEPNFHYSIIPHFHDIDLSGYFQSEKYFIEYENFIKQVLEFKHQIPLQPNTTSIHIRRGDYLVIGNNYHTNLSDSYYNQAMSIISSNKYMIFSDDIAWCKSKFIGSQFIFSENNSPAIDLAWMAACENNIIANSSFSWWGAWLNKNPSKKIIAPEKWFGPKLAHNTKDLLPEKWIKI